MKKNIDEFKKFIARGNIIDLAIGVIIGGAFSKIVTSLVNNIITPLLGLLLGGIDLSGLAITFKDTKIEYGAFIESIIDFLIIAISIFTMIKIINKISRIRKKEDEKKNPPKKEEIILLEEIRNLLKEQKQK